MIEQTAFPFTRSISPYAWRHYAWRMGVLSTARNRSDTVKVQYIAQGPRAWGVGSTPGEAIDNHRAFGGHANEFLVWGWADDATLPTEVEVSIGGSIRWMGTRDVPHLVQDHRTEAERERSIITIGMPLC